jgi:ABC-2 type transport system permease protein
MADSTIATIARKEFFDLLFGRRFLLLLGILLAVSVVGLVGGIGEYQAMLDQYNEHLSTAGDTVLEGAMREPPSVMLIFESLAAQLGLVLGILGIATGFDLIAREKETRSLKQLLAAPIYRDQVINGKALGGMAALVLALALAFAIALAALMVAGIVPTGEEVGRILLYGAGSLLLCASFFSCALAASAISDESGTALVASLIVFTVLALLVPVTVSDTVMNVVAGEAPEPPVSFKEAPAATGQNATGQGIITTRITSDDLQSPEWERYMSDMREYGERRGTVQDLCALFSPTMNFNAIAQELTGGASNVATIGSGLSGRVGVFSVATSAESRSTADRFAGCARNFIALLVFPAIFFGCAYTRFMRQDVR